MLCMTRSPQCLRSQRNARPFGSRTGGGLRARPPTAPATLTDARSLPTDPRDHRCTSKGRATHRTRSPSPRTTTCLRSATSKEGNRGREEGDDGHQDGGRGEVDNVGVREVREGLYGGTSIGIGTKEGGPS